MPRQARDKKEKSRKKKEKRCRTCGLPTRWLSVDGNCWDCVVKAIKNKSPLLPPKDVLPEDSGDDSELN